MEQNGDVMVRTGRARVRIEELWITQQPQGEGAGWTTNSAREAQGKGKGADRLGVLLPASCQPVAAARIRQGGAESQPNDRHRLFFSHNTPNTARRRGVPPPTPRRQHHPASRAKNTSGPHRNNKRAFRRPARSQVLQGRLLRPLLFLGVETACMSKCVPISKHMFRCATRGVFGNDVIVHGESYQLTSWPVVNNAAKAAKLQTARDLQTRYSCLCSALISNSKLLHIHSIGGINDVCNRFDVATFMTDSNRRILNNQPESKATSTFGPC